MLLIIRMIIPITVYLPRKPTTLRLIRFQGKRSSRDSVGSIIGYRAAWGRGRSGAAEDKWATGRAESVVGE